jgi:adenine-specific DNA-methyltransferase
MGQVSTETRFVSSVAVKALEIDPYRALDGLTVDELKKLVVSYQTRQPLGLYWERDLIAHDKSLNSDNVVMDRIIEENGRQLFVGEGPWDNLIIEGDNFDALRLLKRTHAGRIRVIFVDPPYNTGEKDWVYNDRFVGKEDSFRFSTWLEFLYQRFILAKDLLTDDGVILVTINDDNRAKLELMLDQVFEGMRIGSLVWRSRDTTSAAGRNFSDVHEHILVYGKSGFSFIGSPKSKAKYRNPDNDPRGIWNGDPLTLGFDRIERANLFYPLQNPATGIWYPCDPTRVWAYATESRVENEDSLQAETMESFISKGLIIFPQDEQVRVWGSLEELMADIRRADVPVTPKRKRPLLTADLPDLAFWVGKKVGFGRPLFKKFWTALRSHTNPVGSWIGRQKEPEDEDVVMLRSPQAGEGSEVLSGIFHRKVFNYPKPPTLIENILRQTVGPEDTVLDFFAGSGTTAHAVLKLNRADHGHRRFILVSSTEATPDKPNRNICRDVCAARIRHVVAGYAGSQPLPGSFAYARLRKVDPVDFAFDLSPEQIWNSLTMFYTGTLIPYQSGAVNVIERSEDSVTVFCASVTQNILEKLKSLPERKIRVYSDRPETVAEALDDGHTVESLSAFESVRMV